MDVVENNRPELIHACRLEETSKCLRNMMSEKLDQKSGYECLFTPEADGKHRAPRQSRLQKFAGGR